MFIVSITFIFIISLLSSFNYIVLFHFEKSNRYVSIDNRSTQQIFSIDHKIIQLCWKRRLKLAINVNSAGSYHCVKSVQIRNFFWSAFCFIRTHSEYRKIRTRKNSVFGFFSRSASLLVIAQFRNCAEIFATIVVVVVVVVVNLFSVRNKNSSDT